MKHTISKILSTKAYRTAMWITFVVMIVPATTGSAIAAKNDCGIGRICAWKHVDYRSCFDDDLIKQDSDWSWGEPRWDNCFWPGRMNDQVSSYWNRSNRWVIFYEHKNGDGHAHCVAPGAASPNVGPKLNDTFSSHTVFWGKPSRHWCNTWDFW